MEFSLQDLAGLQQHLCESFPLAPTTAAVLFLQLSQHANTAYLVAMVSTPVISPTISKRIAHRSKATEHRQREIVGLDAPVQRRRDAQSSAPHVHNEMKRLRRASDAVQPSAATGYRKQHDPLTTSSRTRVFDSEMPSSRTTSDTLSQEIGCKKVFDQIDTFLR